LIEVLDVESVIAQLLVTEGYISADSIANENIENLKKIGGFDITLAKEIITRAINYVKEKDDEDIKIINEKISDKELINLNGMNNKMLAVLAKNGIFTLDDFANLATYDLIDKVEGIFKELDIEEKIVNGMIMKAREKWFKDEQQQ
jgi:N utilization substance protein A